VKDWFQEVSKDIIDLRVGHALYLESYWEDVDEYSPYLWYINRSEHMEYPYGTNPVSFILKENIKDLHNSVENVENVEEKHIVIGAGITQLLMATFYAIKEIFIESGNTSPIIATAEAPYWPRFPVLCRMAHNGIIWSTNSDGSKDIEIITSPNNPDGSINQKYSDASFEIHDLCYNWPHYIDNVTKFDENIMLFSMSKLTGHAGTRIGWGLFKDKELADRVQLYLELTTCGVSLDAQYRAGNILSEVNRNDSLFGFATHKMKIRWSELKKAVKELPMTLHNDNGMFAWCSVETGDGAVLFQEWTNAAVVNGEAFGHSKNFFRISLGCSDGDWDRFIDKMQNR